MVDVLARVLIAASLVLAAWALVGAVRASRPGNAQLVALAVLELLLVLQALVVGIRLVGGADVPKATVVGYLLVSVVAVPAGVFWGVADRSRWGNGVIAIACVVTAVLVVRLVQVWGG